MDAIKEWKVYTKVAEFLGDILWRYHGETRIVKGKIEGNFWKSIPFGALSPEQREELKEIMKKEVKK